MAQAGNCDQFQVGTKAWTDCIHDAATGGGLMPWIVVIPLAVMVVGMMIGFARQFSAAGRRRAASHGTSGTAGTWLIFVSFVELAIGFGNVIAVRRGGGGGYGISATILLGVGAILFLVGAFLKIKGRGRARIYNTGLPGEALVRAVHETGVMVNNKPMYQFEVDLEGSGFAPTATTMREVVPFWMAGRVGPDTKIPVKVDPSNPTRAIIDWDRFGSAVQTPTDASGFRAADAASAGGQGAAAQLAAQASQASMPSVGDMARAMDIARSATGGSGWHVGKIIGAVVLLLVLAVVGGGLYFISTIFGSVKDATSNVTDQVNDAMDQVDGIDFGNGGGEGAAPTILKVSREAAGREPVGYSIEVPPTWNDETASIPEDEGPLLVDVFMRPKAASQTRIVVARSLSFMENPGPAKADITSIRREVEAEYGDTLTGSRLIRLAREPAVAMEVSPEDDGLRSRQIAVMRGGQVIFASLIAERSQWDAMLPVFEGVLSSWKWSPS